MQSDKFILGAGKIYFDPEDAAGNLTGLLYVGDTPGFTINVSNENVETWSADGPVAERQRDIPVRTSRAGGLQIKNISMTALAWFVGGTEEALSQSNTPVASEVITVKQGRTYQLGRSVTNQNGVRNVSSFSIVGGHSAGTDYVLDAAAGLITIVEGGGISDDSDIDVGYTPAAETRNRVTTNQNGAVKGALMFKADNTDGDNRDMYIPLTSLNADGDLAMKSRDEFQLMPFQLGIGTRTGWAQIIIDDRAVA